MIPPYKKTSYRGALKNPLLQPHDSWGTLSRCRIQRCQIIRRTIISAVPSPLKGETHTAAIRSPIESTLSIPGFESNAISLEGTGTMPEKIPIKRVSYYRSREMLYGRNGIIALCRPSSLLGKAITHVTHAAYSHATLLGWPARDVFGLAEQDEGGARVIPFSEEVRHWPGFYDLFDVKGFTEGFPDYDGDAAWSFMVRASGAPYGYRHLTRVWLRRRIGSIIPAIRNSDDPQWPRDCSALVHAALRLSGGPILKSYDSDVVPGDLSNPAYFSYIHTVFYSEDEADALRRAA